MVKETPQQYLERTDREYLAKVDQEEVEDDPEWYSHYAYRGRTWKFHYGTRGNLEVAQLELERIKQWTCTYLELEWIINQPLNDTYIINGTVRFKNAVRRGTVIRMLDAVWFPAKQEHTTFPEGHEVYRWTKGVQPTEAKRRSSRIGGIVTRNRYRAYKRARDELEEQSRKEAEEIDLSIL